MLEAFSALKGGCRYCPAGKASVGADWIGALSHTPGLGKACVIRSLDCWALGPQLGRAGQLPLASQRPRYYTLHL